MAGTVNIAIQGLTLLTYMLGAVFVIVTVIIVCGKVLMREQKDIGIYKALGFTSFRLRCQLAVRFIVTAVVGSLLGIVLALIVSKPFFKAGFESFGDWKAAPVLYRRHRLSPLPSRQAGSIFGRIEGERFV